jgi:hypothetical protein
MIGKACLSLRMLSVIIILISAFLLQACVDSQLPLLDETAAVVDPSMTGHYTYTYSKTGIASIDQTGNVDVYQKGKQFLVVQNGKLRFIVTVNQWDTAKKTFIGQAREVGQAQYVYFSIRKTDKGAELNFFSCTTNCRVTNFHDLSNMTFSEEARLIATKTGDL